MHIDAKRAALTALLAALLILDPALGAESKVSDGKPVASYVVDRGTLAADPDFKVALGPDKSRKCAAIRDYAWSLIPVEYRRVIARLRLTQSDPNDENASDGTAVQGDAGDAWELSFDYDEGEKAVVERGSEDMATFDQVVIHELGHVVSLSLGQIDQDGRSGGYEVDEGTLKSGAYLNAFYLKFWRAQYPAWKDDGDDQDAAAALYQGHPDSFVTEYAATSPAEDFAETFAAWVSGTSAGGEAARKLQFFMAYPELVAARAFIRKGMLSLR